MLKSLIKKYLLWILKAGAWLIGSLLVLFLVVSLLLQLSSVQTFLIQRITTSISSQTNTRFDVERVAIRFPKSVGLKGIYAEDTQGDTLLYAGSIFVDVRLTSLLRQKVDVNLLELNDVVGKMIREEPDTVYNYQFLIDAFADEETPEADYESEEAENGWSIDVRKIHLEDITFDMYDHTTGLDLQAGLKKFTTDLSQADLLTGKYHLGATLLERPEVQIQINKPTIPPEPTESTGMPLLNLALAELKIAHPAFSFTDYQGTSMAVQLESLLLIPENIELHNYLVKLQTLTLEKLVAQFDFPQVNGQHDSGKKPLEEDSGDTTDFSFRFADLMDWSIGVKEFSVKESFFQLVQDGFTPSPGVFNPENLKIDHLNMALSEVLVSPENVRLHLQNISMNLGEEMKILEFSGDIELGDQTRIEDFFLHTGESKVGFSFASNNNFLHFAQDDILNYHLDFSFLETHIQEDLAYFMPVMNQLYFNWPDNHGLRLGGGFSGKISDLKLDSLQITAPEFFTASLHGNVKGLPRQDSLSWDLPMMEVFAAPGRFMANLPDTLKPQGIQLPNFVYVKNKTQGSVKSFEAYSSIQSDLGNIALEAYLEEVPDGLSAFSGKLVADEFDVGKLLMQSEKITEPVALNVDIVGKGTKPEEMNLEGKIELGNLTYNQYAYNDWIVNLELKDSVASVSTNYQDDKLSLELEGGYAAFSAVPALQSKLVVHYAQLGQLGVVEDDLLVKTNLQADLVFDVDDFFSGHVSLRNTSMALENEIYDLPELQINSGVEAGEYILTLRSQIADADFSGNFSPARIPGELTGHFSHYYELPYLETETDGSENKQFELELIVKPNDLISNVVLKDVQNYDTLNARLSYNKSLRRLSLEVNWPRISYAGLDLTRFNTSVHSDHDKMNFVVSLEKLDLQQMLYHDLQVAGSFRDQLLDFDLSLSDFENNPLYALPARLEISDSLYVFHLRETEPMINGELWQVSPDNRITFGKQFIQIHNFNLQSQERLISLASREHEQSYPIVDAQMQQIDLGNLTHISDSLPVVGGMLNGHFSFINFFENPSFLADISVDEFSFRGDTIGDIVLKAENPEQNLFEVFATVKSKLTDITVTGNYRSGEQESVDMQVNLERLDLPSFEGFAGGNLTHLQGYLSGKMNITGTTSEPMVAGELNINETAFRVPDLNAGYFLKSEQILFDRQQLRLQGLSLEDSMGRNATLNGNVNFADLNQLAFDISLSSRNFLLMNVKPNQNDLYHGRILMDTDLRLTGSQDNPEVEGRIKLNEGSDFTFYLPQTMPEAIGDEGVVEFVQPRDTLFYQMAREADSREVQSSFERLDLNANIEIDRQTDVKIIIDEYAGDFLEVQGGGVLSLGVDPGGRVSLSGRYEMVEGEYLLTFYDVIRRNFRIRSGSNIVWTGDPLNANVDITAIYTIRTGTRELMAGQAAGDQAQGAAMRQQFPFLVYLKMKGNLMEPQISFELDLPPEHQNAMDGSLMARINQINQNESELNKQVFALLILGNFIQENPFASLGGGDLTSTARSSASQILSQQLNRLSDRYVRGVDINIEVESFVDFTDGDGRGRTELQMEVSRDFFDERVRVSVGGNIELEDEARRETNPTDIAGDFSIEYLINPEGNLILKGFRKRNYGDVFDGQVTETGVSIVFSRSYNQFRELFMKKEEESEVHLLPEFEDLVPPDM